MAQLNQPPNEEVFAVGRMPRPQLVIIWRRLSSQKLAAGTDAGKMTNEQLAASILNMRDLQRQREAGR